MSFSQGSWQTGCKVKKIFKHFIFHTRHYAVFQKQCLLYGLCKKVNASCSVSYHFTGTGVTTYSLHPGVIRTELGRHFWPTMALWKRVVYTPLMFLIKSPTEGAQTTIYCAVEESLQNESGLYYRSVNL